MSCNPPIAARRLLRLAAVGCMLGAAVGRESMLRASNDETSVVPATSDAAQPSGPQQAPQASAPATPPSLDELFLFQPTKYPQGNWRPEGLDFEEIQFNSDDGLKLDGWYCPHEQPRAVLLYAHGNAGNVTHRAAILHRLQKEHRVSVMCFDYRGYGRSAGFPTADGILRDARAARTCLARRANVRESDIVLMGRSLGGAVAVHLAANGGARGLILESTFTSVADVAVVHYPPIVAQVVPQDRLNSASLIVGYTGPLLQSHGDHDRLIPFEIGQKLFGAANKPKQFVRLIGRDHNDPQPAEYYKVLDRFLDTLPPVDTGRDGAR